MHEYMAAYGHIYSYMQCLGTQEVHETSSQRIHTQEAGTRYILADPSW